ncbi:putative 2S sulfur-rich seed storage protein precursor large subunit [Tripterygium wilfordii]|uniref:Putative 2S sulfur-rich seed storage protein large subunit n=1 Tax=Tripterygium wilfordii TaxID=458696 RepID=A0A7J7CA06_TRIWF|nr:2S albumin-like [Tripterygium wilfordii]KAF5730576.1 putative 2S sulfur-rich seed storage protein precursor large subunit [Tripterygium wilfordii]
MAKFTVFLATLAVLLLLTEASIYRTTIQIDEENPSGQGQQGECQEQIRRQQNLRHCQEYIRQQSQQRGRRGDHQGQDIDQCCDQLEELETRCRCQGLQQAVREQQSQRRGQQPQEERRMLDVARDIPSMCDLQPRECQFSSPRVWF